MSIRTTYLSTNNRMVNQLMTNQSNLLDLQMKLSSQKNVTKPSDDPVAASQILTIEKQQNKITTYNSNIATAKEQLDMLDSSLAKVIDVMQRASDLAVESSNETVNPTQLKGIKGEIDQIKASIVDFANTQYNGQYIFSGNNTTTPTYSLNQTTGAVTYQGSNASGDSARSVEIMEGVNVPLNVKGVDIFGSYTPADPAAVPPVAEQATGIFGTLSQLSNALGATPTNVSNISAQIDKIKDGINTVTDVRTQYGAYSSKRLDMTTSYLSDLSLSLDEQKSGLQDLDMVKTITDLNNQNYAYQASLQTSATAMKLSLLNYI